MSTWPERPEREDPVPVMWWSLECPAEAVPGVDWWNGRPVPAGDPQRTKEQCVQESR